MDTITLLGVGIVLLGVADALLLGLIVVLIRKMGGAK